VIHNTEYWINFYNTGDVSMDPSPFAIWVSKYLDLRDHSIVDLGTGNGRDARFFESLGCSVIGVDTCENENYLGSNLQVVDATRCVSFHADIYYARFFIHSLEEQALDLLLQSLSSTMTLESRLCIETRSSYGITDDSASETWFQSSVGTEHFRCLYSLPYLYEKISKHFVIEYALECKDLAPYNGEDPTIIRMIVRKKIGE